MSKVVIKRRIGLGFLGEEYKEGYVEFKVLSIREATEQIEKVEAIKKDNKAAIELMQKLLEEHFVSGLFKSKDTEEKLTKEDIGDFSVVAITRFFKILSGQDGDPKY